MGRIILVTLGILLFNNCTVNAQTWQWGKRGGSYTVSGGAGVDETVDGMATDKHGNVYVLSTVYSPGLDVDGHARTGYSGRDIMLSSFKCDGTYRWSKLIGSNVQNDYGKYLKTDTLGGVYVAGYVVASATQLHIDTDSVWNGGAHKDMFLLKYDTAGVYKWFRMPQPDSTTAFGLLREHQMYDMDVDGSGNIFLFCLLPPAAYSGGAFVIANKGYYMLKYNSSGVFQNFTPMSITYTGTLSPPTFYMKRDHGSGKYYITGSTAGGVSFGGTAITHTLFVGCFSSTGSSLWTKQNVSVTFGGPFTRAGVDDGGNVYLTGLATNGDVFNSYTVSNPLGIDNVPIVTKMDQSGNFVWGANGQSTADITVSYLALTGTEVAIAGNYPFKFKWGTGSLQHAGNCGYSPFLARLSAATGAFIHLDSLASGCGTDAAPTDIVCDKKGNFYIGGAFGSTLTVNGATFNTAGGGSDFWMAKFGNAVCTDNTPQVISTTSNELTRVSFYPNPATDLLEIITPSEGLVTIMDMKGATVAICPLTKGKNKIMTNRLVPGLYIMQYRCGNMTGVYRMEKQ